MITQKSQLLSPQNPRDASPGPCSFLVLTIKCWLFLPSQPCHPTSCHCQESFKLEEESPYSYHPCLSRFKYKVSHFL